MKKPNSRRRKKKARQLTEYKVSLDNHRHKINMIERDLQERFAQLAKSQADSVNRMSVSEGVRWFIVKSTTLCLVPVAYLLMILAIPGMAISLILEYLEDSANDIEGKRWRARNDEIESFVRKVAKLSNRIEFPKHWKQNGKTKLKSAKKTIDSYSSPEYDDW